MVRVGPLFVRPDPQYVEVEGGRPGAEAAWIPFFSLGVSAYGGALKKRYNLLALMDSDILGHGIMTVISSSCLSLVFVIVCRPLCLSHSGYGSKHAQHAREIAWTTSLRFTDRTQTLSIPRREQLAQGRWHHSFSCE
jgi:hypothetical protein